MENESPKKFRLYSDMGREIKDRWGLHGSRVSDLDVNEKSLCLLARINQGIEAVLLELRCRGEERLSEELMESGRCPMSSGKMRVLVMANEQRIPDEFWKWIGTRSIGILERNGIEWVSQLNKFSIYKLRGIGGSSLREIEDATRRTCIELRGYRWDEK